MSTPRSPPKSARRRAHENRLAVPLRHINRDVDELLPLGQAHHQPRLHRRDLHTIRVVGAPFSQVVLDVDHVLIVLGHGQADVAIRPAAIVIADDAGPADAVDVEHRIERRANAAGQHADVELLPLLGGELEAIDVARLRDDAAQGHGGLEGCGRRGVRIRLGLEHVAQVRKAEDVRRRSDALLIFGKQAKFRRRTGGQRQLLNALARHVP